MEINATNEVAPEADTPEAKRKMLEQIAGQYRGNRAIDQRSRLLRALSHFPVTTLEARKYLDILHPPGRIKELRRRGWLIDTFRVEQLTDLDVRHHVGQYVLRGREND